MARRGRPTVEITLRPEERATLQRSVRRHSSSQALALRSKIVLGCADGSTHAEIAAELGCNPVTVGKWRHRFTVDRLDGLVDAFRPGAARSIGDDVVEAIVVPATFAALEIATGKVITDIRSRHTSADFVAFLNKVDRVVPPSSTCTSSWTTSRHTRHPMSTDGSCVTAGS